MANFDIIRSDLDVSYINTIQVADTHIQFPTTDEGNRISEGVTEVVSLESEFKWLLEFEVPQALEEIFTLMKGCQKLFQENSTNGEEQRTLLIPNQNADYVKGTLQMDGDVICKTDLYIKPSPKSTAKPTIPVFIRGSVGGSWKLYQIRDSVNTFKKVMSKLSQILHRQDIHLLTPPQLSLLISDIIQGLQDCRQCFEMPKRLQLKEIQSKQNVFRPPLPDDIIINIYISSYYLVITLFYLSSTPHKHQMQATKPILSIGHQESYINTVIEGAGSKEYEVVYQGEGSCPVPKIKTLLIYFQNCIAECQSLLDKVNCFI